MLWCGNKMTKTRTSVDVCASVVVSARLASFVTHMSIKPLMEGPPST